MEAVKLGSTAIGIQTTEGVLLCTEKKLASKLQEPTSVEKIMEIDSHVAFAMSGLIADSRTLVDHARVESQNHRFTYMEPMKVRSITQAVCDLALGFGDGGKKAMSRPFGVALIIAGCDEDGPQLYHADPSGTFTQYKAKAIGSGAEGAQTSIQEDYDENMTMIQAEDLALKILKEVMEEKLENKNVEVARLTTEGYHLCTSAELDEMLGRMA